MGRCSPRQNAQTLYGPREILNPKFEIRSEAGPQTRHEFHE